MFHFSSQGPKKRSANELNAKVRVILDSIMAPHLRCKFTLTGRTICEYLSFIYNTFSFISLYFLANNGKKESLEALNNVINLIKHVYAKYADKNNKPDADAKMLRDSIKLYFKYVGKYLIQ